MSVAAPCCPVCSDLGVRDRGSVNGYAVHACTGCGAGYAWPRPTEAELAAVYGESYFDGGPEGSNTGYASYGELPELNARAQWPALLDYLGTDRPAGRTLLDVGCATGGFLAAAAADGWDVVGTEYSDVAAERSRVHHGIEVESGTFAPVTHRGPFDLVTGWHVLEHIIDPVEALASLRPLVRTGGVLFIEVPSWNSLGRRVRGTSWSQLKPPEHLTYFTPHSLAGLARSAGFRVVRAHSIYPSIDTRLVPLSERKRVVARNAAGRVLSAVGLGGYVRLVATSL